MKIHSIAKNLTASALSVLVLSLGACRGEPERADAFPAVIRLDWAYWSPIGIVLKEKRFLETALKTNGHATKVEWTFSLGSNKSLEYLNSKSTDFSSSAGVAAFISRANGNDIRSVYSLSKPEWTALLVAKDSKIASIEELKGKKVAATRGTDPFVFLARALDTKGLGIKDVEYVAVQHPDGKNALLRGDVDAWAGLDPLMAQAEIESGAKFLFRNADFNTYNVLSVREDWVAKYPQVIETVISAYEEARAWALANPDKYLALITKEAKLTPEVAAKVIERTDISNPKVGAAQIAAISAAGTVLKKNGVIDSTVDVQGVANALITPQFSEKIVKP